MNSAPPCRLKSGEFRYLESLWGRKEGPDSLIVRNQRIIWRDGQVCTGGQLRCSGLPPTPVRSKEFTAAKL